MDLDAFFSIGQTTTTSAQNTFTNRTAELDAFVDSVAAHVFDDPVAVVEDLRSPRRNVLVYYGMGGVGKTRLSKELDSRYETGVEPGELRATFRVDFDEGGASDLEGILLGLRASLGRWKAKWPAFDLAFAVYWERAHPGVPLQFAVNNATAVRRLGQRFDLGTQLSPTSTGCMASRTPGNGGRRSWTLGAAADGDVRAADGGGRGWRAWREVIAAA